MDQAGAPRHDFNDFVFLAEEVAGRFDTMAPKVVQRSAPRLFHIPEVRTVGPPWDSRERTQSTRPTAPRSIICRALTTAGAKTSVSAYPCIAPEALAASRIARASAAVRANGLVHI